MNMKRYLRIFSLLCLTFLVVQPVAADAGKPDYILLPLVGHAQQMPLSCESRSAVDVAAYWGVHIEEKEFFNNLPKTDDPNTGFVGNVYERWGQLPPNGYGVHAEPVAGLLRAYGLPAQARYGMTIEELEAELAAKRPVILWATPRMASQEVVYYTSAAGAETFAIRYEHTVIAVGYNAGVIYVVDAATGYLWGYSKQSLVRAWDKLNRMSVVVMPPQASDASAASPSHNANLTFNSPGPGSRVQVPVEIRGTVQMPNFASYELWYAAGSDPAVWNWISGPHMSPVMGGQLTGERLEHLTPGTYTLRVVAYNRDKDKAEERSTFTVVP
jgi:uncharacterized protein YvpB